MTAEEKVGKLLIQKHKTLSVAESCTGGLLANRLTNISGSSKYFVGGVLVYANSAKIKLLKVSALLIKKHGAVSPNVAKQMAKSTRTILKTDFGISITGIAGPRGGTKNKPVGLTYIAVASHKQVLCREFHFKGSRLTIKKLAAESALEMLLKQLQPNE